MVATKIAKHEICEMTAAEKEGEKMDNCFSETDKNKHLLMKDYSKEK